METARRFVCSAALVTLILVGAGCGIRGVEGHYVGTVTGSLSVIGIPFPINGDLGFDLVHASADLYDAVGDLMVRRKSDGVVTYQATLSGTYAAGALSLHFAATDGKSSGTMTAGTLAGLCWNAGTWTITGLATSGSGGWSACR